MKTYNWEGVNPDGYFLDKLEPIPQALPSFRNCSKYRQQLYQYHEKYQPHQKQNQRYGSSHIGATAKDISNVVTDAASGVVDIFHGIDKAVADTWNNFWKDGKADGIGSRSEERFSRNAETDLVCRLLLEKKKKNKKEVQYLKHNGN